MNKNSEDKEQKYTLNKYEGRYLNISGKTDNYSFQVYKLEDYKFDTYLHFSNNEQPGIYIFTKRTVKNPRTDIIRVDGLAEWKESAEHQLLYCGKAKDINNRFYDHHKNKDLIDAKFNCVCIYCCKTESEATNIEKDLLGEHNFKFNIVLNNWELHFNEVVEEHNNLK